MNHSLGRAGLCNHNILLVAIPFCWSPTLPKKRPVHGLNVSTVHGFQQLFVTLSSLLWKGKYSSCLGLIAVLSCFASIWNHATMASLSCLKPRENVGSTLIRLFINCSSSVPLSHSQPCLRCKGDWWTHCSSGNWIFMWLRVGDRKSKKKLEKPKFP